MSVITQHTLNVKLKVHNYKNTNVSHTNTNTNTQNTQSGSTISMYLMWAHCPSRRRTTWSKVIGSADYRMAQVHTRVKAQK